MECARCGETPTLSRRCRYCDRPFCRDHLLPENHGCPGLDGAPTGRRFESDVDVRRTSSDRERTADGAYPTISPETYGSPPAEDLPSSPDVNPDGSLATEREEHDGSSEAGVLSRVWARVTNWVR